MDLPRLPHAPRRPIPVADKGLQPERTSMSWTRTGLAMLVCAATLLRWSPAYPGLIAAVIGGLAVVALVIFGLNRRAYRHEADALAHEHASPNTVAVALTTLGMLAVGGLGLYLVLVA